MCRVISKLPKVACTDKKTATYSPICTSRFGVRCLSTSCNAPQEVISMLTNLEKKRIRRKQLTDSCKAEARTKTTNSIRKGKQNKGFLMTNGQFCRLVRGRKLWSIVGPGDLEWLPLNQSRCDGNLTNKLTRLCKINSISNQNQKLTQSRNSSLSETFGCLMLCMINVYI